MTTETKILPRHEIEIMLAHLEVRLAKAEQVNQDLQLDNILSPERELGPQANAAAEEVRQLKLQIEVLRAALPASDAALAAKITKEKQASLTSVAEEASLALDARATAASLIISAMDLLAAAKRDFDESGDRFASIVGPHISNQDFASTLGNRAFNSNVSLLEDELKSRGIIPTLPAQSPQRKFARFCAERMASMRAVVEGLLEASSG